MNCRLKHIIKGNVEGGLYVTGRRRRRRKLLCYRKVEIRYWNSEEALDRTLWRTRFGRIYGPVIRQASAMTGSSVNLTILILITLIVI